MGEWIAGHRIEWWHDDGRIVARVDCQAGEGSLCRLACQGSCEGWARADDAPELCEFCRTRLIDSGDCQAVLYLTADGPGYVDERRWTEAEEPVRSGPIEVRWWGNDYEWRYAQQVGVERSTVRTGAGVEIGERLDERRDDG